MKQNKCTWGALATSIFVCGFAASIGHAQTTDALLDKLVNKGILTADEAKELKKEQAKTPVTDSRFNLPPWLNSIKLSADFRARYDGIYQSDNVGSGNFTEDRNRFRYRLRAGFTADLGDHFEFGMRLASGDVGTAVTVATNATGGVSGTFNGGRGQSPFSANTTLDSDATRKDIFIDLAYGKWTPCQWATAEVGKMNNAFWFTDMSMDPDYNPEGAQQKFGYNINDSQRINYTAGEWVIAENFFGNGQNDNKDVYLFVNQLDWAAKWTSLISTRFGVGIMNFLHQKSIGFDGNGSGLLNQNGTPAGGAAAPNFNPIIARGEVTFTLPSFPLFHGGFPITPGGEYANNPGAGSHVNEAYNIGVTFGSAKAKGNWQLSYNYKNIETASVWHGLNDDDFGFNGRGGTDVRGHQVIGSYHPYDPLFVNFRYMRTERIGNPVNTSAEQDRIFFDLVWAF